MHGPFISSFPFNYHFFISGHLVEEDAEKETGRRCLVRLARTLITLSYS